MKFILLTEHLGHGSRFPYCIRLISNTWEDARQEVKDMLKDESYWEDGLCIGTPKEAELIEIAESEHCDKMDKTF